MYEDIRDGKTSETSIAKVIKQRMDAGEIPIKTGDAESMQQQYDQLPSFLEQLLGFDQSKSTTTAKPVPDAHHPAAGSATITPNTSRFRGVIDGVSGVLKAHPKADDGNDLTDEERADASELLSISLNLNMGIMPKEDENNPYDKGFTYKGRLVRPFDYIMPENAHGRGKLVLVPETTAGTAYKPATCLEAALKAADHWSKQMKQFEVNDEPTTRSKRLADRAASISMMHEQHPLHARTMQRRTQRNQTPSVGRSLLSGI